MLKESVVLVSARIGKAGRFSRAIMVLQLVLQAMEVVHLLTKLRISFNKNCKD